MLSKFGVKLKNLNIDGVTKGEHTRKGEQTIFNITKLKTWFKLECLIKNKSTPEYDVEEDNVG
jgi:hypothetical protein